MCSIYLLKELVYALLPNRQEETYRELLQILQTKCNNINIALNLTNVTVDFELAMINALRHVFGQNMDISGCFFTCARTHGNTSKNYVWQMIT